jgi:hypothetical protein
MLGHYGDAEAAAERALIHYRAADWPTSGCLADLAAFLYFGPTPAAGAIERLQMLLEDVDLNGEATIFAFLGGLEAMRGRFDDGRERVARAKELYDELGQTAAAEANCGTVLGRIEVLAGDDPEAERVLRATCLALEAMGDRANLATRSAELADVLLCRGSVDEAETCCRLAETLGAPNDAATQVIAHGVRARLLAGRGAGSEAAAIGGAAVDLADRSDALNRRAKARLDLAEVHLAGRPEQARVLVDEAIALYQQKGNSAAAASAERWMGA